MCQAFCRLSRLMVVLAMILPALLAACGGSDASRTDETTSASRPSVTPSSSGADRATAAPYTSSTDQATPGPDTSGTDQAIPTSDTSSTDQAIPTSRRMLRLEQTSPETDREVLIALYNATDGPNWSNNINWLSDVPLGEWNGVYIDDDGRVVALELRDNQLSGEIPGELVNLANLEYLGLADNQLSGEIPGELGSLANLFYLGLDGNQLSGCVPTSLQDRLTTSSFDLGGVDFC